MRLSDINTIVDIQTRNLTENTVPLVYLRDLYDTDFKYNYVCVYKDDIVGFISCTFNDGVIVNALCVDYPHRNKHIGLSLINAVKEESDDIKLYVRADNKVAINFYIKCKFKIEKEDKYYMDGELGILMRYNKIN